MFSAETTNWIVCREYSWITQSFYFIYCSLFSYIAPMVPKVIYCCKIHSLLSIIIILWRFVVVFHPRGFEGFPQGTSCVMVECFMWLNILLIQILSISTLKRIKDQISSYLHKNSTWYQSSGHEGAKYYLLVYPTILRGGGESVLSVFTLNCTKSTIKTHILLWKPQKRKPPTQTH